MGKATKQQQLLGCWTAHLAADAEPEIQH